ncbi:HU family DNA-binding protein [Streptomyces vilmorinianum]|uniref:HU family DNA-binding protein n=1 Tax=Streptomyces vilmorinianum TaxID=3051092 RepID=UPI0010FB3FA2|nr:HU family DNA-binding protein [Streptomyces vilmorinianum]
MARKAVITTRLNTTALVHTVAAELDISQERARDAVFTVFDIIARAAAGGHDTAITNFGTFVSSRTSKRKARNPQTGETLTVPAHQVVRFRPSPRLVDVVRRRVRKASIAKLPKGALPQAGRQ